MGTQALDEEELDEELENLQQEQLDNNLLSTGQVPVGDKVGAMPSAPQSGKFTLIHSSPHHHYSRSFLLFSSCMMPMKLFACGLLTWL